MSFLANNDYVRARSPAAGSSSALKMELAKPRETRAQRRLLYYYYYTYTAMAVYVYNIHTHTASCRFLYRPPTGNTQCKQNVSE